MDVTPRSERPLDDLTIRPATTDDVPRLAALATHGFDTYRDFAPAGWEPPDADEQAGYLASRLEQPGAWAMLAEHGGVLAGHVVVIPAAISRFPEDDDGLAHFMQLFLAPEWWGSGLATRLHTLAIEAAREHGYTAMRLYTPAAQARARRFYEREGWELAGPPVHEDIGFEVAEYRRSLA
jgi:ribosomal protein S18 acetylase RimI-like enzyme